MEAKAEEYQGGSKYNKWYQNMLLKSLENILKLILKQMASRKPISNTTIMVEPKAKRKYKTKNEKEDTTLEEFAALGKILVKEEVQNLRVTTTHLGFYN
jgi:hypothetical protein